MPYADRLTTPESILDLFNEFSVEASDGALGGEGAEIGGIRQLVDQDERVMHHNLVLDRDRISFVELTDSTTGSDLDVERNRLFTRLTESGVTFGSPEYNRQNRELERLMARTQTVRGRSTLKTIFHEEPNVAAVPCYFLPWNPTGGAVELRIPEGDGPASNEHPNFFLTAALSGCSIYVAGTDRAPRIFHCGTQNKTTGDEASTFWNRVVSSIGVPLDDEDNPVVSAHNKDYMTPLRGSRGRGSFDEQVAGGLLKKRYGGELDIEDVKSWGAVFGVRDGARWKFYLQENTTITYYKLRTTKWRRRRVRTGESRTVSRPLICRQIFPVGGGRATLFSRLRDLPR